MLKECTYCNLEFENANFCPACGLPLTFKRFNCEYATCLKKTEFKAGGKHPLCSEHHSLYIFIQDLMREDKER
jgi:predicted amidophosphoribosyltransferase